MRKDGDNENQEEEEETKEAANIEAIEEFVLTRKRERCGLISTPPTLLRKLDVKPFKVTFGFR